ncbi:cytochrome c oxidase assembly protein [Kocuria palustris]|uniref:cytochrome c oxidase assembly protein n=1 Tax=Kocuria palustris TaxID=71999 RepID=UPI0011A44C82|nr:cytochrome c oxidase assembly protein [Kocuria palustris]
MSSTADTTAAASGETGSRTSPGGDRARPSPSGGADARHGLSPWWPAAALLALLAGLIGALAFSGAAAPQEVADPGALVRWGLPIAEAVRDVGLVVALGSILVAISVVPHRLDGGRRAGPRSARQREQAPQDAEHPLFARTVGLAGAASVVWTVASVVVLILTYADVSGVPVSASSDYTRQLVSFATEIPTGQALAVGAIVAAVTTTMLFGLRSRLGLAAALAIGCIGIVTMALNGHSAGGDDHMGAVNSLGLHLLGVCLWAGGLAALAWISRPLAADTTTTPLPIGSRLRRGADAQHAAKGRRVPTIAVVLRRFSAVALWCYVLVLASGIINAGVRIGSWTQLTSDYGILVLVKVILTLLVGVAGLMHRRAVIPALDEGRISGRRAVWQVVLGELVLMGALIGVAVALGNSAPPVPEELADDASPARVLTFYELPPEPTAAGLLTMWRFDWLWVAIIATLGLSYGWALWKVSRVGGRWSPLRAVSWYVGLALLMYATSGGLAIYARVLFSAHMVEHMSLTMIIPVFLVLGSPVTLLLRALEPRQDGTRGPREWILRLVHSTWGRVVTHPIFAGVNFAASIVIFYFTPLLGITLRTHVGHEFMMAHFLFTGYMFALVLVGQDPIPYRPAHFMRLVLLIATMVYHAFVGVTIMGMDTLLEASWFGNMGRDWGPSAIEDQQIGGALMWGIGELPTALLAVVVAIQWALHGRRENRRVDREAERTDDAELEAYNAMMQDLAERDRR